MYLDEQVDKSMRRGGFTPEFLREVENKRRELAAMFAIENLTKQAKRVLRDRFAPTWVKDIVLDVASAHGVSALDMVLDCRVKKVVKARNEAIYFVKYAKQKLSLKQVARWFGKDHTSILHAIACHSEMTGAPRLTHYDIERVRNTNRQSARKRKDAR